jgi:chromosome segregation ATPase
MYQHLEGVKKTIKKGFSPRAKMSDFESALKEHLESLRQDLAFMKAQLMNCRQANTDLQLRIHALEHAAHVNGQANLEAGDQLREAQALIQRQREYIGKVHVEGLGVRT